MPNLTANFNLKKPIKATENADIDVINYNMDLLDEVINARVLKVTGKGLSTEDYTTTEKNKLSGITANATFMCIQTSMIHRLSNKIQTIDL